MTSNDKNKNKKPKWLRILEQQSWQAELIISGIAIFGSLQLLFLLVDALDWVLINFQDASMGAFYVLYMFMATQFLVIGFIFHFILRALWIGMIGLVSVFPNGISESSEIYSPHFLKSLKTEFSDINGFNEKIDNLCSILFSIIAIAAQMFTAFAVWIVVWIVLQILLLPLVGESMLNILQITLLVVFMGASIFLSVLNSKKMRDKEWVKRLHYPIARGLLKIYTMVFYTPFSYISYTLFTNPKIKKKHTVVYFVGAMLIGMLSSIGEISNSSLMLLKADRYFYNNSKLGMVYAYNYESQMEQKRILHPTIQSEVVAENYIRLFIPRFKRENPSMEKTCGNYEQKEENSRRENRALRDSFRLECLPSYYTVAIDDEAYTPLQFLKHIHKNKQEVGYLTYLSVDSLKKGQHLLKIERAYLNEDGDKAVQYIPFWKG